MTDQANPAPEQPAFPEKEAPTSPHASVLPTQQHPSVDSLLMDAIRTVSEAARDIREEREERKRFAKAQEENAQQVLGQQGEILAAIQKADSNNTANYELLRSEMVLLKKSDADQDEEISRLKRQTDRLSAVERSIADLKQEILDSLPDILQSTLKPYIDRIEALEVEARKLRAAQE